MRALVLPILLTTACGFSIGAAVDAGVIEDGHDVDAPLLIDAAIDTPGTMVCPWPYAPRYIDPCTNQPQGPYADLDLSMNGTYVFSSDGAMLTPPSGTAITLTTTAPSSEVDARIVWVNQLRVQNGTTLRLIGATPVIFVSTSTITIEGIVDASSKSISVGAGGAGSNPAICGSTSAGGGAQCNEGGSGGGAGGFGTFGGNGGVGALTRNCVPGADGQGITGGAGGGAAPALPPSVLRGGCGGGNGAQGNGPTAGTAGRGGGAIALVARDAVIVRSTGKVHAGGSGGRGANGGRSGGGGGGSGGMIVIAGATVLVEAAGVLAANGGGGGGGANGQIGMPGNDGTATATAATGGAGEGGNGNGGNGTFAAMFPQQGSSSGRGGGGAGGGAGVITFQTEVGGAPVINSAVISPLFP